MFKSKPSKRHPQPSVDPVYKAKKPEVLPINFTSLSAFKKNSVDLDGANILCEPCHQSRKSNFSLTELSSQLDFLLSQRNQPWSSPLIFYNIYPKEDVVERLASIQSVPGRLPSYDDDVQQGYDILPCLGKEYRSLEPYLYFDPVQYSSKDGFQSDEWCDLRSTILMTGLKSGYKLFCNGKYQISKHSNNIMFCCSKRRVCRTSSTKKQGNLVFRSTSSQNDRTNSRGQKGQSMIRRTTTNRALCKEETCRFFFVVSYDSYGFYIVNGYGNRTHCNHGKVPFEYCKVSSNALSNSEKELVLDMDNANAHHGISRSVMHQRIGVMMSLPQVRHLTSIVTKQEVTSSCEESSNFLKLSAVDRLIRLLKKEKHDVFSLLYEGGKRENMAKSDDIQEFGLISESFLYNSVSKKHEQHNGLPISSHDVASSQSASLMNYAITHTTNLNLKKEQSLMIAICWVTQFEKRQFNLFPRTLFVDCTSDTNKEKRPFFTISARDSNGKMFIVLRAFFPNEKTWAFRWIFSTVLPLCFPASVLDKIVYICSDGDSQEFSQIDAAIKKFFPRVTRGRCAWHIFDRGMMKHGPKLGERKKQSKYYLQVLRIIYLWMFSWAKEYCSTREQFKLSKYLFWRYINSSPVIDVLGQSFTKSVTDFIRVHVEPLEEYFCFYYRRNIRHFDEYSNSCHEGTNKAVKYGTDAINPAYRLDNAAQRLCNYASKKYTLSMQNVFRQEQSTPLWLPLKCAQDLVERGYQLLFEQWKSSTRYMNCKISSNTWLVKRLPLEQVSHTCKLIPSFINTNTVHVQNDVMYCSCCLYERFGLPCRHMLHVLRSFPDYSEPSKIDISVLWWKSYYQFGYQTNPEQIVISKLLQEIESKEANGPSCPEKLYERLPIYKELPLEWGNEDKRRLPWCSNYRISQNTYNEAMSMLPPFGMCTMSQQEERSTLNEDDEVSQDLHQNLLDIDDTSSNLMTKKQNFHAFLSSSLKSLHTSGSDLPMERWVQIRTIIDNISAENHLLQIKHKPQSNTGTYVSSCVPDCKRRKTHGTKY